MRLDATVGGPFAAFIQPQDFEPFADLVLWRSAGMPRDFALMALGSPSARARYKEWILGSYDLLSGRQVAELRQTFEEETAEWTRMLLRDPGPHLVECVAAIVADGALAAAWALGRIAPPGRSVAPTLVLKRAVVSACRRGLADVLARLDGGFFARAPRARAVYRHAFRPGAGTMMPGGGESPALLRIRDTLPKRPLRSGNP